MVLKPTKVERNKWCVPEKTSDVRCWCIPLFVNESTSSGSRDEKKIDHEAARLPYEQLGILPDVRRDIGALARPKTRVSAHRTKREGGELAGNREQRARQSQRRSHKPGKAQIDEA